MKLRSLTLMLILLLLVPLLAACGGDDNGNNDGDNGDSQSVSLSQTFSEAGLTFSYPEGWVAESMGGEGGVAANSQEVLELAQSDAEDVALPDGAQAALVFGFAAPAEAGLDATSILELFTSEGDDTEVGEIQEFTLGEREGVTVTMQDSASDSEGAFYVFPIDDSTFGIVAGISNTGDYNDALIREIVESVQFTPPAESDE